MTNDLKTSLSILLVDDSQTMRYQLKEMLTSHTHNLRVYEASSVDEAQKWLSWLRPDYLSVDLDLNGESGLSIVDSIRERMNPSNIAVVTASESLAVVDSCITRGVKYITKGTYLNDKEEFVRQLLTWIGKEEAF